MSQTFRRANQKNYLLEFVDSNSSLCDTSPYELTSKSLLKSSQAVHWSLIFTI